MVETREKALNRKRDFDSLQHEARKINMRYLRGSGIVGKHVEPPPKREISISDFISREGFNIGALGI